MFVDAHEYVQKTWTVLLTVDENLLFGWRPLRRRLVRRHSAHGPSHRLTKSRDKGVEKPRRHSAFLRISFFLTYLMLVVAFLTQYSIRKCRIHLRRFRNGILGSFVYLLVPFEDLFLIHNKSIKFYTCTAWYFIDHHRWSGHAWDKQGESTARGDDDNGS